MPGKVRQFYGGVDVLNIALYRLEFDESITFPQYQCVSIDLIAKSDTLLSCLQKSHITHGMNVT